MSNKKGVLLFSGFNPRAILAFLRTLEKNKFENYFIIAKSKDDELFKTKYKDKIVYTRESLKLDIDLTITIIKDILNKNKLEEIVIIPSSEAINRFLLKYRKKFEEVGAIIPLVDENLYIDISDKENFTKCCLEQGLKVPSHIEFPKTFENVFVAKPKKYETNDGKIYSPVIIENESDFVNFIKKYPLNAFYYQEYVEGRSIYLLYYFTKDGQVYKLSQENYLQQYGGKSIIAAEISDFHKNKISSDYEKLFLSKKFFGLVMVELRLRQNEFIMIEANPRLWGPSQLFVDASYNFFEIFLKEWSILDIDINLNNPIKAKYFWSEGLLLDQKHNKSPMTFNNKFNLNSLQDWIQFDLYNREDTKEIFNERN
ncbi:hypothetical protein [Ureibacillus sp. FSL K6-0786]|uniref:hypothetical protein n=1 Tax=Ureibacillus sp. FSL K6-0786 TaxID=2954607 RepID=UPI0030DBA7B0